MFAGVTPNTDILKSCGVNTNDRGYVIVDGEMCTNVTDIYAGGDIVSFPMQMTGELNVQRYISLGCLGYNLSIPESQTADR